jgi:hypothetical protein
MTSAVGPDVDAAQGNSADMVVLLLSEIRDLLRAQDSWLARLVNIQAPVQEASDRPIEGENIRARRNQENNNAAISSQDLPLNVSVGLELHRLADRVISETPAASDNAEDSLSAYNNSIDLTG